MTEQDLGRRRSDGGRWALVAWQGVGAEVPASWNIVAVSGDGSEGYLRADGPAEESLELRWQRAKRQPDLKLIAEDYLKGIRKTSRKQRVEYDGELEPSGGRRARVKPVDLRFRWQSDRASVGRLHWCADCRRTVIAQVSAPVGVEVFAAGERILDSVRDHSHDDLQEWGVYGLVCQVPRRLKLARHRLMSGFLSLNFSRRGERIIVERWGLAEELLQKDGLWGWHQREYLSELRSFRGDTGALEWGEHEALETTGVEGGPRRALALMRAWGIPGRAERFASIVWHCPETNRIIGVRGFGRSPEADVRAVAATIRCHEW